MPRYRSFATAIAVLLLAYPLAAQGVSPDTSAVSVTPIEATVVAPSSPNALALLPPTLAPAWTNVDATVQSNAKLAPARMAEGRSSQAGAMMIVGGAALLVGAIVAGKSGTVLMVGGGVLGLIGLWEYVR